jgi:hypothetical protein
MKSNERIKTKLNTFLNLGQRSEVLRPLYRGEELPVHTYLALTTHRQYIQEVLGRAKPHNFITLLNNFSQFHNIATLKIFVKHNNNSNRTCRNIHT